MVPEKKTSTGIEAFPEIENFQKLPHQVIVKAGRVSFDDSHGATLHGIVINNCGHAICDIRANIVIFNGKKIPVYNSSVKTDPEKLSQGSMAAFLFNLKDCKKQIPDYHLYTTWRFDNLD